MPWAVEPTLESVQAFAARDERAWQDGKVFAFALRRRASRDVLGVAGLDREGEDAAEIHYWIRSDHTGKGLTTEACRTLIAWARAELRLERLTLWAGRENHASRRVAEKLGFTHLGPLEWRPEGGAGDFEAERYELRFSA